ncbi:MAG: UpxY family transcription antiterminator [Nitrospira sp.]|nr:UpxY family transcription antiterminator [Nitrospira sp.]
MRTSCQKLQTVREEEAPAFETDPRWYALHTHCHQEKQVRDRLLAAGIEPFLPVTRQYRQWSDRKVWTISPLFRGYCFARFRLDRSLAIRKTPGVARIVGIMKPEPIRPEEITALQQIASSDRPIEPCEYLVEGISVEVVRGPLAGLRGEFIRKTKQHGLVIRASCIQQAALIHIEADEVVPIQ